MFLFTLGTVPLLLGFGALSSFLSAKLNRRMLEASGVLVIALGLVMFTPGMNLFGVALPTLTPGGGGTVSVSVAAVAGGFQEVRSTVEASSYHPFIVQKGIAVRWTVSVKAEDLNGCNNPLTVPQYGIRKREGTIAYTCWMGMVCSSMRIVPAITVERPGWSPRGPPWRLPRGHSRRRGRRTAPSPSRLPRVPGRAGPQPGQLERRSWTFRRISRSNAGWACCTAT